MIKVQRRNFNAAKRREIIYDIQRYVSQHVYVIYGPSVMPVVAWEPYVKNFGPNIGHDYGGRPMVALLGRLGRKLNDKGGLGAGGGAGAGRPPPHVLRGEGGRVIAHRVGAKAAQEGGAGGPARG